MQSCVRAYEPISVVADADVVFRHGWVDAVLVALEAFPKCGMLSLHPAPDLRWHASSSAIAACWVRRRLVRARVVDPADLHRFYQSVGRAAPAQHPHGELLVSRGDRVLGLGFAHFAFAVRKEVVANLPLGPSLSSANGVDVDYFELPADAKGWWCLSSPRALVHRLGNSFDREEERRAKDFSTQAISDPTSGRPAARPPMKSRHLPSLLRRSIVEAGRFAERRSRAARWLAPERQIELRPGSATRVQPARAQRGGGV